MSNFPDYYSLLNIPQTATHDEVRQAYKKESLRTHPDRLVNGSLAQKQRATEKFQAVADAYYVLSDPQRRKEYDNLYASKASSDRTNEPSSSYKFFSRFSGTPQSDEQSTSATDDRPDAGELFTNVFEELLRPEVESHAPWWSYFGALCGGGMGFIIANIPGLMLGAYAGNRLGAVRDAKGKSIATVFNGLGGNQKAEILRALAMKVLGSAF